MEIVKKIQEMQQEMMRWRQKLHTHPELAFEERETMRYLQRQLQSFGVDEIHPLAKTGVIGVLHGKNGPASATGGKTIMLHAAMDALPINEESGVIHTSGTPGVHHACGHDGHMAMLLGAAKYLAQSKDDFDGTILFVFQPAEEHLDGAQEMLNEGLLKKFPCDEIYGLHSYPWLPLGTMASETGQMLAASDEFHVTFSGTGGHMPHPETTTNLAGALAEAVSAMNAMLQKEIPAGAPTSMVVSSIRTDSEAADVISSTVHLKGCIRGYDQALHDKLKQNLEQIVQEAADKYGATVTVEFKNEYLSLVNSPAETSLALDAAREVVGDEKTESSVPRTLNVTDFARFLLGKPGNFMALGTGRPDGKESPSLHSAKYDFNDAALPIGASYWVKLVEKALPPASKRPDAPQP